MRRSLALIAVAALLPMALVGCDPGALPEEGNSSQASTSDMQSLDQFGFTFAGSSPFWWGVWVSAR